MTKQQPKKRFIIGMYVEDEPGVLNRISGMFSRRGFNIDTVTVGKTKFPHLSQIVVSITTTPNVALQMERQLQKIATVRKTFRLDEEYSLSRELCLVKVASNHGFAAGDLNLLARRYGAKIIDANDRAVILEFAAAPDQVSTFLGEIEKFGLIEISRTGITSMRRVYKFDEVVS
ncbi:MAG: acetolactate synthase small subunit [Candidatus Ranarchaeia archaeon]